MAHLSANAPWWISEIGRHLHESSNTMNLLVVGGSGYLGGLVLPILAQQHPPRFFDRRPPADPGWEYVAGHSGDLEALSHAAAGMDALLYMAMGNKNYSLPVALTT